MPRVRAMLLWLFCGVSVGTSAPALPKGKHDAIEKFRMREGGACNLPRVNASGLTPEVFAKKVVGRRAVLLHSIDGIEKLISVLSKEEIIAEYGNSLVSYNNHEGEHKQRLNDYFNKPTGEQDIVFELGLHGNFSRGVWKAHEGLLPKFMRDSLAKPIFTIGNRGAGTSMHQHEESILFQLTGRKAWWLSNSRSKNSHYWGKYSPCQFLGQDVAPGFQFCVALPGQALYFPNNWYHATCNIDDFTWGLGAQGRTATWPRVLWEAGQGDLDAVRANVTTEIASGTFSRALYAATLQRALSFGREAVVEELVRHAAKMLNAPPGKKIVQENQDAQITTSPVHAAVQVGDAALVKKLLRIGFDPEEPFAEDFTALPLVMACSGGHTALVKLFARKKGPRFNRATGPILGACLFNAAKQGHLSTVKLLLSLGAELDEPGPTGELAVHGAAGGRQLEVLRFIVGEERSYVKTVDGAKNTPLHSAARHGSREIVEFLLEKRARHDAFNDEGLLPLHIAAQQGQLHVVESLLHAKARVHDASRGESNAASAPLHFAAGSGAVDVAELLVERRADVSLAAAGNMQPLHEAAVQGSGRFITEFLVEHRASLSARNIQGMTPLDVARRHGHVPTMTALKRLETAGYARKDDEL